MTHHLNDLPDVVHIQRHIVFEVNGPLRDRDIKPVRGQSCFVFIVSTPDDYGRVRLETSNLVNEEHLDNLSSPEHPSVSSSRGTLHSPAEPLLLSLSLWSPPPLGTWHRQTWSPARSELDMKTQHSQGPLAKKMIRTILIYRHVVEILE